MLVGYVSDERYVAVADALLEFESLDPPEAQQGQPHRPTTAVRSTARGAVYADLPPGPYRVTLVKSGFGSKSVELTVARDAPAHHFRLLSDGLLGYMWPKWVRSGERSEFRVHAVAPYRLSLWRYGWNKELVRLLGWFDEHGPRAVMQLTPDGDYTQSGVAWNRVGYGNNPHLTQFVVGPERSGLYYLHAEAESGGAVFTFPWIVAPDRPRAPVAVLASTNTWNAYNNFGGRSNYINSDALPPRPTVNARQDLHRYTQIGIFNTWGFADEAYAPLSFERPEPDNHVPPQVQVTDPIRGRAACHLAPAEWRLLGWLEREGFAYDLYAEAQLHQGQLDLDAYRVLILNAHPEYWSRAMYERVKAWVHQRGGRLMYLGGNGINCEVELIDQATMRCKTHRQRPGETPDAPPGESRFRRTVESEAALLGVAFTDTGIMTAAPYRVLQASHWVFAGTGLRDGDLFGTESQHERCPGGASGHETDKIDPASPPGTQLLAKGLNPDNGGAEMAYYELPQGGAVFAAGSIIWPSSVLVDEHVSRITRNVLRRFLT
ncbi:MAG TPA: N,N-dimethylformamidase beta subunit family domain-containing protein [Chloroflexota bacterium]|nr:N,N-dimethylformamidase beta subunit family domain-containing protein [Chloroflexota bacterium]